MTACTIYSSKAISWTYHRQELDVTPTSAVGPSNLHDGSTGNAGVDVSSGMPGEDIEYSPRRRWISTMLHKGKEASCFGAVIKVTHRVKSSHKNKYIRTHRIGKMLIAALQLHDSCHDIPRQPQYTLHI